MNTRVAQRRVRFVPGVVALVASALLVGSVASPSAGAPTQPAPTNRGGPPVPTLDWTDCGDGFQCATAVVPLDYQHPRGETIELALIRKPALDQANRIGSLFLNPGGPGGSGIDMVRGAPEPAFHAVARFDVVGFDPRGVGASRPAIDCGVPSDATEILFERPQTIDPAAFEAEARAYGNACLANNPTLLPHVSTANVARDLDLLRAAVGDERLNFLGFSYGSVIGATYATLFPGRARAMVIDSPLDVQGYYDQPVEIRREQGAGFENALDRFFMACAAAGDACGFGGADPELAFDRLLARLNREPLPSTDPAVPFPVNGDLILAAALSTMYDTSFWPPFAAALVAAEAGDPGPMLQYLSANDAGFGNDATVAVWSVDQRFDRRVDPYFANGEHAYALLDHFWWDTGYRDLFHAVWPVEDRGAFRGDIENPTDANPILVIGVTYDPATPYIGAERLTADLGNARLLTYEGDGHGALTSLDPCLWSYFVAFLNDLTLPPEGTTCVDPRAPFPSAAGRSTSSAQAEPWLIDRVLPTT
jgi:pimeloyl-ACP methyl ester carboxylesterase